MARAALAGALERLPRALSPWLAALALWLSMPMAQAQRIEPVNLRAVLAQEAPRTLAAYRLFTDARARTPNAGVTPYTINTQLYSDGALKFRYVFTPPGRAAAYVEGAVFDFPVGTVLVKTFAVAADMRQPQDNVRFLETRLLIRQPQGWVARAYVWNAEQTEARLAIGGASVPAEWIDADGGRVALNWSVPNQNQCAGCHAHNGAVTPIGPRAANLARGDQLQRWVEAGHLASLPAGAIAAMPDAFDPQSGPLDRRARAYLDVNCAHCHNPAGPAHTSGLDLSFAQQERFRWGVRKRPVAAGRGSAGLDFSIDPGHPERSILLARMESLDPGVMMPELGRQRVDRQGVALIRDWIAQMDAQ